MMLLLDMPLLTLQLHGHLLHDVLYDGLLFIYNRSTVRRCAVVAASGPVQSVFMYIRYLLLELDSPPYCCTLTHFV